jgi:hypothetical protein
LTIFEKEPEIKQEIQTNEQFIEELGDENGN